MGIVTGKGRGGKFEKWRWEGGWLMGCTGWTLIIEESVSVKGKVRFVSLTSFFVGSDGNTTQCHISVVNLQI